MCSILSLCGTVFYFVFLFKQFACRFLSGILFDFVNQECLLSFSLLLTAIGTAAAPWSTNYFILMGLFACQGVSMGFLDTGTRRNVSCLITAATNGTLAMPQNFVQFVFGRATAVCWCQQRCRPLCGEEPLHCSLFQRFCTEPQLGGKQVKWLLLQTTFCFRMEHFPLHRFRWERVVSQHLGHQQRTVRTGAALLVRSGRVRRSPHRRAVPRSHRPQRNEFYHGSTTHPVRPEPTSRITRC